MNENFKDILAEGGEILIDSLIKNEIVKEIPILGTSINLVKGIQGLRDRAYLNKVKRFVESIGEIDNEQKQKLIDESRKDKKRRVKFGDALFTTIEQSDSLVKVEYLAAAFEAFLNSEIGDNDLKLICHIIRSSYSDELVDIIENENPQFELKYSVASGLTDVIYPELTMDMTSTEPKYKISYAAEQLQDAWKKYKNE